MPPTVPDILFALGAFAVVALSAAVVLARNPVRSTLLLILSFFPVSLLFILMRAPFAALLQIMVYAGAIMMLFTFVIMMVNPGPGDGEIPGETARGRLLGLRDAVPALLLAGLGCILIPPVRWAAARMEARPVEKEGFGGVESLAQLVFGNPADSALTVSFELVSVLILVGVIAAVHFGRRRGVRESGDGEGA